MSGSKSATPHRRLSVAMIVRDCADLVAGSLQSVREVADEIVVVDTGSRDRTREVALKHASRVFDFEWCDDFAAARNSCLGYTTGDWVLWLDAGETISPQGAEQLRNLVDTQTSLDRAYLVMVQTPPSERALAGEQIGSLRLHVRRSGIEFTGRVREEIGSAIEALGHRIELAPFTLLRSPRDHDLPVKHAKAQRNAHLAALEIQEHGVRPSPLLAMAEACVTLGQIALGIEFFSRALTISPQGSTCMLEAYYGILAALDHLPQARDKQLALCQQGLDVFPFDAQLLCAMGSYLQQQNRIDLACRAFAAAARYGQVDPQTWHLLEVAEVASVCQAACQDLMGDTDAARRTLEEELAAKPGSQRIRRQLLEFYIRHDCRREALELVGQMPAATPHKEALRSAVRGACLAANQNWIPAVAYLQTAFGTGCRDVICLRGLMMCHLASEDLPAAERLLREWRSLSGASGEVDRFAREIERLRGPGTEFQRTQAAQNPADVANSDRSLRIDAEPHPQDAFAPKALPHSFTRSESPSHR